MLGESCWSDFRERVQRRYNYSLYTCHQTMIDGLSHGKFDKCVVDTERLCVAPACAPAITTIRYRAGRLQRAATPHTSFARPPPPSPPPSLDAAGLPSAAGLVPSLPGLVLLGCEGCGVPDLWRTLSLTRALMPAAVDAAEPSWRDRQVLYFDHETRWLGGPQWCAARPHPRPSPAARQPPPEPCPPLRLAGALAYAPQLPCCRS